MKIAIIRVDFLQVSLEKIQRLNILRAGVQWQNF